MKFCVRKPTQYSKNQVSRFELGVDLFTPAWTLHIVHKNALGKQAALFAPWKTIKNDNLLKKQYRYFNGRFSNGIRSYSQHGSVKSTIVSQKDGGRCVINHPSTVGLILESRGTFKGP